MECEKMNEDRLVEIETKIAFQEKTIKDLSDTVYNQQKQIDTLNETLKHLIDQIKDSSIISPGLNLKDEKPPHY
jgi:SlyX protein